MRRFAAPTILAVVLLTSGALGGDDAAKKDLERLQGTWKVLKMEKEGEALPPAELEKQRVVITGDKFVISDGGKEEAARIKLDPSKKPAAINLNLSSPAKMKKILGIYKLEGDKLTLCFSLDQPRRPRDFVATKTSGTGLLVLQCAKK